MNDQQNNESTRTPEASGPGVRPQVNKEPPKSAPPKKELTTAQMQKRRKMRVMPLFILVFVGCMWLIFAPSKDKDQPEGTDGFNAELPIPKDEVMVGDKRTAYEQEAIRQRDEAKMRSLQELSAMIAEPDEISQEEYERQLRMAPKPIEYYENPELFEGGSNRSSYSAITASASAYKDINRQLDEWYEQPATEPDEQAQLAVEWRIQELERRLEEAQARQSAEDEQTALLEKSYQLAAKYIPQQAGNVGNQDEDAPLIGTRDKVEVQPVSQVRHNVVSLLSAPMSDDEFIEAFTQPRNMGFHTAAGNEGLTDKNSIRACVYQTITLTSGKELQIRLLEPMRAGHILIPANTVVTGACRIGGERMEVTVNSIQYAGNIIPVELQVYDMDGQRGIFVPGSEEINAAKEVTAQLAQSAGTSITITDNAGSQLAADLGKGLIQGASQYVSKKLSVIKVTVKANYELLLLPKTQ